MAPGSICDHHLPSLSAPALIPTTQHLAGRDNRLLADGIHVGMFASDFISHELPVQDVKEIACHEGSSVGEEAGALCCSGFRDK